MNPKTVNSHYSPRAAIVWGLDVLERIRRLLHPIDGSAEPAADNAAILLCELHGVIRDGSSGNPAVEEMAGIIERALA